MLFASTLAVLGEMETEIGSGGAIVIGAEAERVVSATEFAVRVTIAFAGTDVGGV